MASQGALEVFTNNGWYADGSFTEAGKAAMAELLEAFPRIHEGLWGKAFLAYMRNNVALAAELIVTREQREVLLTWRDDVFFQGWHTPGKHKGPGESWQETASRIATAEIGCEVEFQSVLGFVHHPAEENSRFAEVGVLLHCNLLGAPCEGSRWFSSEPEEMLRQHRKFWPFIKQCFV